MNLRRVLFLCVVLIDEVQVLKGSDRSIAELCGLNDLCKDENRSGFTKSNCMCDRKCFQYGDCCEKIGNRQHISWNDLRQYQCVKIKHLDENQAYYMIGKCIRSWPEDEIKARCHSPNPDAAFFSSVPVTDVVNLKIFRNSYCAICNNAHVENITFWQLKVHCFSNSYHNESKESLEKGKHLHYNSTIHQWEIKVHNRRSQKIDSCKVQIQPPEEFPAPRGCHYRLISTCPSTWKRKSVKRLCYKYTAVRYFGSLTFKNKHCAKCHGLEESDLSCPYIMQLAAADTRMQSKLREFSLPRLLSYTIFMHTLVNHHNMKFLCPEGQIRNPVGECEEFRCSRDSIWKHGQCVEF